MDIGLFPFPHKTHRLIDNPLIALIIRHNVRNVFLLPRLTEETARSSYAYQRQLWPGKVSCLDEVTGGQY
jgi:hypothetical protein